MAIFFSKATVAAVAPLLLGLTHASPIAEAVRPRSFPSFLTPNFPVPVSLFDRDPDPSPSPTQVVQIVVNGVSTNVSLPSNVTVDQSLIASIALGSGFDYDFACNPKDDVECYKRWWDFYRYCHPL